jgi:phospholipid/cholesterol/gamma-HCH transport system substrate-binding protein
MKTREQEEKRHEITVALMILIGISVIVFVIFAVSQKQGLLKERYELQVYMSRVNGLQIGAPVRLNGVRVGSVTGVAFSEEPGHDNIKVSLEVQKSVQDKIRANSEAYIGTLGLLGDKFVSITIGTPDFAVLHYGDELIGSDPVDVEKLIDESVGTLGELKKATIQLKEISQKINRGEGTVGLLVNDEDLYKNLNSAMKLIADLQESLSSGEGTLAKILQDTTMYDELYTFLRNTNILTDSLVHGSGTASKLVNDPSLHTELISDLETLRRILEKIDQGDGSAGQMINDKNLYNDIIKAAGNLDSLLVDIKENPKRYLTVKVF